jgi:hypothetical protein
MVLTSTIRFSLILVFERQPAVIIMQMTGHCRMPVAEEVVQPSPGENTCSFFKDGRRPLALSG